MNLEWFLTRTLPLTRVCCGGPWPLRCRSKRRATQKCYARFYSWVVSEIEDGTVATSALWRFA